jgi:hypothetical protein
MKTKYLSLILAASIVPAIAWADDQRRDTDTSQKEGSSSNVTQQQQAPDRGEAKSPAADPSAAQGKGGIAREEPVKNPGDKFEGNITAVDAANKTITIVDEHNNSRTIEVLDKTKGFTGLEAADWSHLSVGAAVKGVYRRDGDHFVAESLSINR